MRFSFPLRFHQLTNFFPFWMRVCAGRNHAHWKLWTNEKRQQDKWTEREEKATLKLIGSCFRCEYPHNWVWLGQKMQVFWNSNIFQFFSDVLLKRSESFRSSLSHPWKTVNGTIVFNECQNFFPFIDFMCGKLFCIFSSLEQRRAQEVRRKQTNTAQHSKQQQSICMLKQKLTSEYTIHYFVYFYGLFFCFSAITSAALAKSFTT